MPPKKVLCRNFQSGSCQYGTTCKFLHASQQQSKPNPFGFGSQSGTQFQRSNQPQQNNPFGFGQATSQPRGGNDFGSKNNQFKPFENKWSRNNGSSSAAQKPDNQSSGPNHKCTDPEECKRQIAEDLQNERPLWKLTCYGHSKNRPCDIVGDISHEELRFAAYNDAKYQGLSLQSIVEKERNLVNAKLQEFESLLRNPYSIPPNTTLASQNPFLGATPTASPPMTQNTAPPAVSSFSQLGTSLNTGFGMRPIAPNNAFGQSNPFQASSQISSSPGQNNFSFGNSGSVGSQPSAQPFGSQTPAQPFGNQAPSQPFGSQAPSQPFGSQAPSQPFGSQAPSQPFGSQASTQPFGSQTPAQPFGSQAPPAQPFGSQPTAQPFGSSMGPTSNFGNSGSLGSQLPNQTFGSSVPPSTSIFGNSGINVGKNPFSTTQVSPSLNTSSTQSAMPFNGPTYASNGFPQAANLHPTDNTPKPNRDNIDNIWLKEEWNPGEIPEEAPPDEAIY